MLSSFARGFVEQAGPRGLGEHQGLLDDGGRVLPPQQLHLHLVADRGQLHGQIGKRQAVAGAVAVGPRCGVAHHLIE